jgi:hypothetical protein
MKTYSLAIIFTSVLFLISGTDDFFKDNKIEMTSSYAKEMSISINIPVSKKIDDVKIDHLKKKIDGINNKSKDILQNLKFKKAIQNAKYNQTDRDTL